MLQDLAMTSQAFVATITQYGGDVLLCVLVAWCIHALNVACQYRLNILGIYPRHVFGLIGIVTSPWLKGPLIHYFTARTPYEHAQPHQHRRQPKSGE